MGDIGIWESDKLGHYNKHNSVSMYYCFITWMVDMECSDKTTLPCLTSVLTHAWYHFGPYTFVLHVMKWQSLLQFREGKADCIGSE